MASDTVDSLDRALKLPPEARAALAGSLLDSLEEGTDEAAETRWAAEIQRRLEELHSGTVTAVPWQKARRQILANG